MPAWFPDADTWAAWAQWVTAAIAFGAGIFAFQQVKEARETRERVAQPEVVVFVDHHQVRRYVDLVIKNFGQTSAYNIRVSLSESLQVAPFKNQIDGKLVTHLRVPENIVVLAPGQEWRTVWDSAVRREKYKGPPLTDKYGGVVRFDDKVDGPDKRTYSNPIALDIRIFWNTMWIEQKKGNTVESHLRDIATTLESYKEEHDGIWVYTVPGDEERAHRTRLEHDAEYAFDAARDFVNRVERQYPPSSD